MSEIVTLSKTLEVNRRDGLLSWLPRLYGEVSITVRDVKTDKIVQQIKQKNLITRTYWERRTYYGYVLSTPNILVSNDDDQMFFRKTIIRNTFSSIGSKVSNTIEVNNTSKTWTFRVNYDTPPTTDRTIYWVGLGDYGEGVLGNCRSSQWILAGTKLSSAITQTTSQTLAIVYRIALVRV